MGDWKKERKEERKALGLCKCCVNKAIPGKTRCIKHNEEHKKRMRATRAKQKKKGLCYFCNEKAFANTVRCLNHLREKHVKSKVYRLKNRERLNLQRSEYRKKWKKEGKCGTCGCKLSDDTDEGFVTCFNCRIKMHIPRYRRYLNATFETDN